MLKSDGAYNAPGSYFLGPIYLYTMNIYMYMYVQCV